MYKTSLDPATIATIVAIPTHTKLLMLAAALIVIVTAVAVFKMKAAVLFALAFIGIAYVSYDDDGVTLLGAISAALAIGVLWLGFFFKNKAAAKATSARKAPAQASV